jgi:hypothetical protein
MSGIVNETNLSALAAEYVIGTLDPDERARANVQLEIDEGFRAMVRGWERRLGELHLMVEPVEPDGRIWERISGRLGIRTPEPPPFVPPPFVPPPFAPPPFASQPAATPPATPFAATVSTPLSAPLPAPPSASADPVAPALEPTFESKFEPVPQAARPLPPAPPFPPPPVQPSVPRTPEQELASLIEEADRFTTQLSEIASAPPLPEKGEEPPAEADSLLAEAAAAIAVKPSVEPDREERVAEVWPEEAVATQDLPPPSRAPRRDSTMLMSPADVAHLTVRRQQRRIDRWRATALLMMFFVLGLGSLIAAWRYAPDRLPHGLQPIAVLGLGEWSPSERSPAEHGTQFEE